MVIQGADMNIHKAYQHGIRKCRTYTERRWIGNVDFSKKKQGIKLLITFTDIRATFDTNKRNDVRKRLINDSSKQNNECYQKHMRE